MLPDVQAREIGDSSLKNRSDSLSVIVQEPISVPVIYRLQFAAISSNQVQSAVVKHVEDDVATSVYENKPCRC
jgi:hypothetical protein